MAVLEVETPEGVILTQEIAGAGSRFGAGVLDMVLILSVYLLVAVVALVIAELDPTGASGFVAGLLIGGLVLVLVAYHVAFHLAWQGATPGKRALGLRVMSVDGYPPSAFQIVLRALIWPFDVFLTLPISIGLIVIAATSHHQRLGDLAAGTLVVRDADAGRVPEPWPRETWSGLAPRQVALAPGMAARLAPADLDFLRDLLTRPGLRPDARTRLFREAAEHYARRLGLGPFEDARVVLRELYLFARESLRVKGA